MRQLFNKHFFYVGEIVIKNHIINLILLIQIQIQMLFI